jgi:hypothetical protein
VIELPVNVFETIKKFMGWCPQEKIDFKIKDEFVPGYINSSKTHANDNMIHKGMDVPLQMFDWRTWAVLFGLIVLILSVSSWIGTYEYLFPFSFILIALLFIFFHTKLSVGSETLRINTPILGDIVIPKNSIKSIEIIENYAYKHKLRILVPLIMFFVLIIFNAFTMQNPIMKNMNIIAAFLFIFVLYSSIHISNYPDMIRINVEGRYILLYPRNENDFLILKDIAPDKSGLERRKK